MNFFILHCPCFAMQCRDLLDLVTSLSNVEIMCLSSKELYNLLLYSHLNFMPVTNCAIVESTTSQLGVSKQTNLVVKIYLQ